MNKDSIKQICRNNLVMNKIIAFGYRIAGRSLFISSKNNTLEAPLAYLWKVKLNVQGRNNKIILGRGVRIKNTVVNIYGDNNTLILEDYARVHNSTFVLHQNNCRIQMGKSSSAEKALFAAVEHESRIIIGEDCMISTDVEIRTSDSHKIYSSDGTRINPKRDVFIGNHVWIGAHANVLKGVTIHDGGIVGFGSILTKDIPAGYVVAGNPAVIVKKDVHWER
ncbi:MAG: acyltransferase [Lachnospiraceae bacterium]|nr:acyltransferase [Lachnospiraceae bacterium]